MIFSDISEEPSSESLGQDTSPIEGSIPADKIWDQSNITDTIPIPVSEEQAVDNTAEI
jgi:hypothetical protein